MKPILTINTSLRTVLASCFVLGAVVLAWADGEAENSKKPQLIRNVVYAERGDQKLAGDIYVPPGEGPFPGVLMIHGGAWMSGAKWHMNRHAAVVSRAGYTVVSISYRLAPKDRFPAQIEDCRDAVRWMRRHADKYKIDANRIAVYGYSAGGHLAALLGVTGDDAADGGAAGSGKPVSTRVQAVVAGGAPCNFQSMPPHAKTLAYFLGGTRSEKPDVYKQASPLAFVSTDDAPVFFFHGANDALVPKRSPTTMMSKLKETGVRCELYLVPDKGHIEAFLDEDVAPRAVRFLDSVLKED